MARILFHNFNIADTCNLANVCLVSWLSYLVFVAACCKLKYGNKTVVVLHEKIHASLAT